MTRDEVEMSFEVDYRRGNLLSVTSNKEVFRHDNKNSLQQTQSDEIASGMMQQLAKLVFRTLLMEPRNDEGKRKKRFVQKMLLLIFPLWLCGSAEFHTASVVNIFCSALTKNKKVIL